MDLKPITQPEFKLLISASEHLTKNIHATENLRIDGTLTGNITTDPDSDVYIAIGRTGVVQGNIEGGILIIGGRIAGDVRTDKHVEMHAGALVQGELVCPDPIIEPGSLVLCFRKTQRGHA